LLSRRGQAVAMVREDNNTTQKQLLSRPVTRLRAHLDTEIAIMGPYTHVSRPIPAIGNIDKAEMDKIVRSENLYIQRAAHTMKDAFLMFREATWHTHILNVKHTTDLVIVDDPNKIGRWQGWFAHFPDHLTSSFSKDKAAVLSNMACYDIAHMKELIEQMLGGTLKESTFLTKC
jgi:hypothetical protein